MKKQNFVQPRIPLLVEIQRYCQTQNCLRLNRIGLTRSEIADYDGFECERCEVWNEDEVKLSEIPVEWRELTNENGEANF